LALSKEIRAACLQGYYHYNKSKTRFNLSMGKFDVSEVSHMAGMLPLNLLQAAFKRAVPYDELFDALVSKVDLSKSSPRLSICFGGENCKLCALGKLVL
jgi:hypothetical protein